MIIKYTYNFLLLLLGIILSPFICYNRVVKGKYSGNLAKRFGIGFPFIEKNGRPVIWVHAVSVGETKAIAPLIRRLKKKFEDPLVIISSITETGHTEAKRTLACADYHVYLPLDFSWIIRPIVKQVSPDIVVISETDFWWNFLSAAKESGATTALVNGKLSKTSAKRFQWTSFFSKKLFSQIDLICAQSEHHVPRFIKVGVPREKVKVTGNLKLDDDYPDIDREELIEWKAKLGIAKEDKVIVVGSTHAPEEELFLKEFQKLWHKYPDVKMVLVPRHPERFEQVALLLKDQNIPFTRLSCVKGVEGTEKVVLIDAMGLLRKCYQFADVAVVAGSFVSGIGGHNVVEPCWYGAPTIFGPHMESQPELVRLIKKFHAGLQIPLTDFLPVAEELLYHNPDKREKIGESGLLLVANSKGATKKTCDFLTEICGSKE